MSMLARPATAALAADRDRESPKMGNEVPAGDEHGSGRPARQGPARLDLRYYQTARKPWNLDHAWRLAEEELPAGWRLAELCHMDSVPGMIEAEWYASASHPEKPDGEHIEAMGATPVHALLALARALHARRHHVGRPPREHIPPALPKQSRSNTAGYRSPALDTVALLGD